MRRLTVLTVSLIVMLSAQGWSGDYVNLFAVFPQGPFGSTLSAFTQPSRAQALGRCCTPRLAS